MNTITFTRLNNDVNGSPRYVCHYLNIHDEYMTACKLANTIGGRKYNTKSYGGGIVFISYSLPGLCQHIARVTGRELTNYTVD